MLTMVIFSVRINSFELKLQVLWGLFGTWNEIK